MLCFPLVVLAGGGGDKDSLTCDTCTIVPVLDTPMVDSVPKPTFTLDAAHYETRYQADDLLYKITDNQGNGFEELYGTRNLRVVLHGAAYRGGANNYFHRDGRRNNQNPLPRDGVRNLCEEGFSTSVYLYRRNMDDWEVDSCNCLNNEVNEMAYVQLDYHDDKHVYQMLEMVHKAATEDETGPVYLHCWNGWHASGYLSAVILKQFCGYSSNDAVNYWDLGTDGMNRSPRYQNQRDRIKAFLPYENLLLNDSLQDCLCPDFPDDIDSSQLHIDLDHLTTVPEAIPVGHTIPLSNIKFKSGSASFTSLSSARKDLDRVVKALNLHPNVQLEVGGHTDNSGSSSANYSLSRQRAKKVYDYLISQGISSDRISHHGYGPSNPVASNRYKSTRAQNRRIEVKLTSKGNVDLTRLVEEDAYDSVPATRPAPEIKEEKKPLRPSTPVVDNTTTTPAPTPPKDVPDNVQKNITNLGLYPTAFESGDKVMLSGVKFEPYSVRLSNTTHSSLKALLTGLRNHPGLKVEIGGYTDSSGDYEGNVKLSRDRARSVHKWLISQGIDSNRITYKGYGPKSPRYTNKTKEGRAKNRRIEIKVK